MRFIDKILIETANLTADLVSETIELETIVNLSVQIVWASTTAAASVRVEVSNDNENWVLLGSAATIANNSGNVMVEKENSAVKYMRVNVDYTSGTVTSLKCIYSAKGF